MAVVSNDLSRASRGPWQRDGGLVVIALVNAGLLGLWLSGAASTIAVEDGILETLQVLVAAGACALFFFTALEDDGPVGTAGTTCAALAAIALAREIDVRTIVVPEWMMMWAYGPFRDTTVAILLLAIGLYLWWRRDHVRDWIGLALRIRAWPFWLSGVLLLSSLAFDGGKLIGGAAGVLVEEFIELNGLMFLLLAGFRHCQLLKGRD